MKSPLFLVLALCFSVSVRGQIVLNDEFDGSSVTDNNGAGSINPGSSATAFADGNVPLTGTSTSDATESGGAAFAPSGEFDLQYLSSLTGNTDGGTATQLFSSSAVTFSITVDDIDVLNNSTSATFPGSSTATTAGYRWEFGVVSAATTAGANNDLYDNTLGGFYVSLYYNKNGQIVGALREVEDGHAALNDSGPDILNLAVFTISSGTTDASYTTPLTVTFSLTTTSYAVSLSSADTVTSGSLSGTYLDTATTGTGTDFTNGVRLNLLGQNWNTSGTSPGYGEGTGDITDVEIIPEPAVAGLMIGAGLLLLTRRIVRLFC